MGKAFKNDVPNPSRWSTLTTDEWSFCEGPVSLISINLPTIVGMARRIYEEGLHLAHKRKDEPADAEQGATGVIPIHNCVEME